MMNPDSQSNETVRSRGSLLISGLAMLLANKRLLLWSWLMSLICGLLATLALAQHVSGYLNHSLAAQQIAGRVDVAYLMELVQHAGKHAAISATPSLLSILLMTLGNFLIAAGSLFVFQSGVSPRLNTVADAGLRYFWRFVRLTLVALVTAGLAGKLLEALREAWLLKAGETHIGEPMFVRSSVSLAVIVAVMIVVRFYFDLVEAVVVQRGIAGDRSVRRSFPVALTLLRENFLRAFCSYLVAGGLGILLFALCLWVWIAKLAPPAVALAFVLGQAGIAALLASRLWQRAVLVELVTQGSARFVQDAEPVANIVESISTLDPRAIW